MIAMPKSRVGLLRAAYQEHRRPASPCHQGMARRCSADMERIDVTAGLRFSASQKWIFSCNFNMVSRDGIELSSTHLAGALYPVR
jgi:hypothetical protein